ncbi:hypothetical protein CK203_115555 [Vitis vinifera]|uniref:Uncharacterized protein n=1 Tax=Vitis vinifera TaxID=29760 RepID=A0A438CBV5_VITVI|nr:hypothetical protein CK203_115555 [Vitis vinifera]
MSNQGRLTGAMRRFAQVVDELELLDLPLQEGVFSWSRGRNNQSWEVKERIVNAFKQLLSEEPGWRADIEGLHLQSLNRNEVKVLELPFTEKENPFFSDGNEWR